MASCHIPADYVAFDETAPVLKRASAEVLERESGRSVPSELSSCTDDGCVAQEA